MQPFVSLITVNFNGKKYLEPFLTSAFKQNYPSHRFEIIVVDNGSSDGSPELVKTKFPTVRLVTSDKNLGFGAANNLGMHAAKGDLFFLVNNDTLVDKKALSQLVKSFEYWNKKTKVGAVNTKLLLIDKYVPLNLRAANFVSFHVPKKYQPTNPHPYIINHGQDTLTEKMFLPFNHEITVGFKLRLKVKTPAENSYSVFLKDKLLRKSKLSTTSINISAKNIKFNCVDLVQNVGSFYFRDGYGRDRGAFVSKQRQYYEPDAGQYDTEEVLEGFCGGGVLLNKKTLKDVGFFDPDFYFYYEDADLSFRMRQHGWKIILSPKAVVRHVHAGSSKEWSDFFIFNAERGRLLLLAKHWPKLIAVRLWISYLINDTLGKPAYYLLKGHKTVALSRLRTRLRVNASIALLFPRELMRNSRLSEKDLKNFL